MPTPAMIRAAYGPRGEDVEEDPGTCPCGEQAAFGQVWTIEFFDRIGLVEDWVTFRLCKNHRARKPGEL